MGRINSKYTKNLKLKIVKRYLSEEKSLQSLANEYGIKSKTQIYNWIKKYQEEGEVAFESEKRGKLKLKKKLDEDFSFENLEDEVEVLKLEINYLRRYCEILKSLLKKEKALNINGIQF